MLTSHNTRTPLPKSPMVSILLFVLSFSLSLSFCMCILSSEQMSESMPLYPSISYASFELGQLLIQPHYTDQIGQLTLTYYWVLLPNVQTLFRFHTCPNNVILVNKQFSPGPGPRPGSPAVFNGRSADIFVDSGPVALETITPFRLHDVSWDTDSG